MTSRYAALTNAQFLLAETVLTAQELAAGTEWEALRRAAQESRLYGSGKASSQLTVLQAIRRRLSGTTPEQLALLATGSLEQRQVLNLALVAAQKQVLLDFVAEVVVPKWRGLERQVTDADVRAFMVHKAEQEREVAAWTPATVQKTRGNLTRFLLDAGILRTGKKGQYDIVPQYLTAQASAAVAQASPRLLTLLEALR